MEEFSMKKQLNEAIQAKDIGRLKKLVDELDELINGAYEHTLHHAFQIQRGSMSVPPSQEVINTLVSSSLISPVMSALYRQDSDELKKLIQEDPSLLNLRDHKDCTVFLRAADMCKVPLIKLLLELGADLHVTRGKGFGALHHAAWSEVHPEERVQTIRLLVESGINVDVLTEDKATPLMLAAMCFKENSVAQLLESGADASLRSVEGKTALDYAREINYKPCIDLLEAASA